MSSTPQHFRSVPVTTVINHMKDREWSNQRREACISSIGKALQKLRELKLSCQQNEALDNYYAVLILAIRRFIADVACCDESSVFPEKNASLLSTDGDKLVTDSADDGLQPINVQQLDLKQFKILENLEYFLTTITNDNESVENKQKVVAWFAQYASDFPGKILPGSNADNFEQKKKDAVKKENLLLIATFGLLAVGMIFMVTMAIPLFLPAMPILAGVSLAFLLSGFGIIFGKMMMNNSPLRYYKGAHFFANEALDNTKNLLDNPESGLVVKGT